MYSDLKRELKYSSRLFSRPMSKLNYWVSLYLMILSCKEETGNFLIVYKANVRALKRARVLHGKFHCLETLRHRTSYGGHVLFS